MLDRIVSLALIVCFLPLPGANSVGAWEYMIFASRESDSVSTNSSDCDTADQPHGRILDNPVTFDPEILVFCEVENEVREMETKGGEDDSVGMPVWFAAIPRNRIASDALRSGIGQSSLDLENTSLRYHILRC